VSVVSNYRYCPSCGAEYRAGFSRCPDCDVETIEQPPVAHPVSEPDRPTTGVGLEPVQVFVSGKKVEADLVRSMLESCGVYAEVWTSGLQPWTTAAGVTEMSGVPNDFGSNRVMVRKEDATLAEQLIASPPIEPDETDE
jgi:hypothetical protein